MTSSVEAEIDGMIEDWKKKGEEVDSFPRMISYVTDVIEFEVKKSFENMLTELRGQKALLATISQTMSIFDGKLKDLKKNMDPLSKHSGNLEDKIDLLARGKDLISDKFNSHIVDFNNLKTIIESSLRMTVDDLRNCIADGDISLQIQIDEINSRPLPEMPEIPIPKDYDNDIEEIRNRLEMMDTFFQDIHPKVIGRVKTLEDKMAQGFIMINRLERAISELNMHFLKNNRSI